MCRAPTTDGAAGAPDLPHADGWRRPGAGGARGADRRRPDRIAPSEFATFQKLDVDGPLALGDDYVVRMPGPWDGPVRVVAARPDGFRFATLRGHLEAGQIEFRARSDRGP